MDRPTQLDLIRAWVEGRLTAVESSRLEAALEGDPELAELAERFRDVHALTSVEEEPPPLTLTFAELEQRLREERRAPARPWRAAAAAVLVLGGAAGAWGLLGAERGSGPAETAATAEAPIEAPSGPLQPTSPPASEVRLVAIELDGSEEAGKPYGLRVPAGLASYAPREAGGIAWLEDFEEARFLAQAARRPILVFGSHADCAPCEAYAREILDRPRVVDLVDLFVPLRWDLDAEANAELRMMMERRGDPVVEIWTPDDQVLASLSRADSPEFAEELMLQVLDRLEVGEGLPEWDELRDLAERYERARAAWDDGRLADVQAQLRDLRRRDEGGAFAEAATRDLRSIARGAGEALKSARASAQEDPGEARAELERALARYAGTAFEPDLRAVLSAWAPGAEFPVLTGAGDS